MSDQQQVMTRAQRAEQIAYLEELAAAAKEAAALHRTALKSAAADEYQREGAAPTWRVKGIGVISGRVKNDAVTVTDPVDFAAWVKAHRPDEIETIERVRPTFATAVLKGCHVNDDGLVVTANGDEIAGVTVVPGGTFEGIGIKLDPEAREAYGELARTALAAVQLAPELQPPAPGLVPEARPAPVAAFLATEAPASPNPWVTSNS